MHITHKIKYAIKLGCYNILLNCFKLQAAKRANKPKVPMPQAQDPMVLIGELVKA